MQKHFSLITCCSISSLLVWSFFLCSVLFLQDEILLNQDGFKKLKKRQKSRKNPSLASVNEGRKSSIVSPAALPWAAVQLLPLPSSAEKTFRYSNKVLTNVLDISDILPYFSRDCQKHTKEKPAHKSRWEGMWTGPRLARCYHFRIRNKLWVNFHKWKRKREREPQRDFFKKGFINGWISAALSLDEAQLPLPLTALDTGTQILSVFPTACFLFFPPSVCPSAWFPCWTRNF